MSKEEIQMEFEFVKDIINTTESNKDLTDESRPDETSVKSTHH